MPEPTLNHEGNTADLCRRNGWGPGTRLAGTDPDNEQLGPDTIEITAVGDAQILARQVRDVGRAVITCETTWVLRYRDWRDVTDG